MLPDRELLDRTARLIRTDFYPELGLDQIVSGLTSFHVEITADRESASCGAGQAAITATALQVAQVGASLELELPASKAIGPRPPLEAAATSFPAALKDALIAIRPQALDGAGGPPDLRIVIGTGPPHPEAPTLYLRGEDFSCEMSRGSAPEHSWRGSWPFGGVAAGAIAAAEVFTTATARLGHRWGSAPNSVADLKPREWADFALPPLSRGPRDLGEVDFASAGAITNGAFFVLLQVPGLSGRFRIFDDDTVALSNLNRCPLFDRDSIGLSKVATLARWGGGTLRLDGFPRRLDSESLATDGPLAETVCIGTDSVAARWEIQRHAPGWVCVGATSHLLALVSSHPPGGACAGCLHPDEDADRGPIPTVSFVSVIAGLLQAYALLAGRQPSARARLAYPHSLGTPAAFVEQPVSANSRCPVGCPASEALA